MYGCFLFVSKIRLFLRRVIRTFGHDKMISVITPAHNEELLIEKCLCSVKSASKEVTEAVEHIVVLNRCTDRTEKIATQLGARIISDDTRNLSHIRNSGAEASKGDQKEADQFYYDARLIESEQKKYN